MDNLSDRHGGEVGGDVSIPGVVLLELADRIAPGAAVEHDRVGLVGVAHMDLPRRPVVQIGGLSFRVGVDAVAGQQRFGGGVFDDPPLRRNLCAGPGALCAGPDAADRLAGQPCVQPVGFIRVVARRRAGAFEERAAEIRVGRFVEDVRAAAAGVAAVVEIRGPGSGFLRAGGNDHLPFDGRDEIVVVVAVEVDHRAGLLQAVDAVDRPRPVPGLVQRRHQHRRQNRDDRYRKMEKNSYLLQSYRLKQTSYEINKFCN